MVTGLKLNGLFGFELKIEEPEKTWPNEANIISYNLFPPISSAFYARNTAIVLDKAAKGIAAIDFLLISIIKSKNSVIIF